MEKVRFKKGKNKVYVWSGGYSMDTITTNENQLSIEQLAYIMIKSNKGRMINCDNLSNIEFDEMLEDASYCYVDMSSYDTHNYFMLIENLYTDNVEVFE